VNSSGKEGFVGIHIADSGYDMLVEKRSFYGDVMPAQSLSQNVYREPFVERLWTQLTDDHIGIIHQPHLSQTTPVVENKSLPVGEAKYRPCITVSSLGIQQQAAGHPEMYNQRPAVRQAKDEVLTTALQVIYPLPD
jgi:hypothetical protein